MDAKKLLVVKLALVLGVVTLSVASAFGQVDTVWTRIYNGPGNDDDLALGIAADVSGSVYVTGGSNNDGIWGFTTVKYDPAGAEAWVAPYYGPDSLGGVAFAIAVNSSGDACVTGTMGSDYATIMYDGSGNEVWVKTYDGPGSNTDRANAITVDSLGNVYVTGGSVGDGTSFDFATIRYYPNGDTAWVRRYNGPGNGEDQALDIAVDYSGNVYVTGFTDAGTPTYRDYATVKYDSSGNELWARRYNGPGDDEDQAAAGCLDGLGNFLVTGKSIGNGSNRDYATIKYDALGNLLWLRRYNGPANYYDQACGLDVDGSDNIYVTGFSDGSGTGHDYATIKYDASGHELWVKRYNSPSNAWDDANDLAVDDLGYVYVTGMSHDHFATVAYDTSGNELWVRNYDRPGDDPDEAVAVAIDGTGHILVTGSSPGSGSSYDYATIKYAPSPHITVISPNGGEIWRGGHDYLIQWWSYFFAGNVRLDYSLNGGTSFDSVIVPSCPNTGEYLWTVPITSAPSCRVRVCDATDYDPADASDADFTIVPGVPLLTEYGIVALLLMLAAVAVWLIRKRHLPAVRNT